MKEATVNVDELIELNAVVRRILGREPLITEIGEILLLIAKFQKEDADEANGGIQ